FDGDDDRGARRGADPSCILAAAYGCFRFRKASRSRNRLTSRAETLNVVFCNSARTVGEVDHPFLSCRVKNLKGANDGQMTSLCETPTVTFIDQDRICVQLLG